MQVNVQATLEGFTQLVEGYMKLKVQHRALQDDFNALQKEHVEAPPLNSVQVQRLRLIALLASHAEQEAWTEEERAVVEEVFAVNTATKEVVAESTTESDSGNDDSDSQDDASEDEDNQADDDDQAIFFLKQTSGRKGALYTFSSKRFTLIEVDITPKAVHAFFRNLGVAMHKRLVDQAPSTLPVFTCKPDGDDPATCALCTRSGLARIVTFPTRCSKHTFCDTCGALYLFYSGETNVHKGSSLALPCPGRKLHWVGGDACVRPRE